MKYPTKIHSAIRASNKYRYGQIKKDNKILLCLRSDKSRKKLLGSDNILEIPNENIKPLEQVLALYNNGNISYSTLCYIYNKLGVSSSFKDDDFLHVLTEFSWESGILGDQKYLTFKRK